MSRIEKTFAALKRPALITFITAGDPDYAKSLSIMKALPGAGADIIELGMPFTDPMADGPAIQNAGQRALAAGANMDQTLRMARDFRMENQDTPVILMGYANPVYAYGLERFTQAASKAGVDGLIIVDLPPEEDSELRLLAAQAGIEMIRLVTPATDSHRLPVVLKNAGGFLYYVSITGVTGTRQADPELIRPHIEQIRKFTDMPIAIGFGIRNPEDAKNMGAIANGIVVGSAIVQKIADNQNSPKLQESIEQQVSAFSKALK